MTARSGLTRLADAAAEHCGGEAVAVVRGFDGVSRRRAGELRRKLTRRGVPAVDMTPMTVSMRRRRTSSGLRTVLDDGGIGLVVDASSARGQAQRLAAELGVPVLHERSKPLPSRISVLGLYVNDTLLGVALDDVMIRPLDPEECQVGLAVGEQPACLTAGVVSIHLPHPEVGRADRLTVLWQDRTVEVDDAVHLLPHWGPFTITADSMPFAPLLAPLTVRCLIDRLVQYTP